MLQLCILVCLSALLQESSSTPVSAAKPKPVELIYNCMRVIPADQGHKPDDVPVILLHGQSMYKETWHGLFELFALETKKEVCIVDLRNHGESPWDSDEFDIEAMTEDIKHLIDDRLRAPKAIVLGHSLGGKIAVHLALNYPEKVEKIIVEDMRPNGVAPEALKDLKAMVEVWKGLGNEVPQGVSEEEAKKVLLNILMERVKKLNLPFKYDNPDIISLKCSDGKCQFKTNPILMDTPMEEWLTESSGLFNGPALFIYGGKSIFRVGEDESNIKKLFPNAKLVEVAEAEHLVHTSKKFEIEVIKFINDK